MTQSHAANQFAPIELADLQRFPGDRVRAEQMRQDMSLAERQALTDELERLRQEHRDLDDAIFALQEREMQDKLQIQRLKKKKLLLKDQIMILSGRMTPDIIA